MPSQKISQMPQASHLSGSELVPVVQSGLNKTVFASYLFGLPGPAGNAGTISILSTSTLTPGSAAFVINTGTPQSALLSFGVPAGAQGASGLTGSGFVTQQAHGSQSNTGVLNYTFGANLYSRAVLVSAYVKVTAISGATPVLTLSVQWTDQDNVLTTVQLIYQGSVNGKMTTTGTYLFPTVLLWNFVAGGGSTGAITFTATPGVGTTVTYDVVFNLASLITYI